MNVQETFSRGLAFHAAGDIDSAMQAYDDVIAADRTHAHAHTNRGVVLYDRKKFTEAIAAHKAALAHDPKSSVAINNLGAALNAERQYEKAIALYKEAEALDPENHILYNNWADSLTCTGRYAEAVEKAQKSLFLMPDYALTHLNLGMAYWGLGRNDAAIRAMYVALLLNPHLAKARANIAGLFLLCGRYAEGWREYEWRWAANDVRKRPYPYPTWDGKSFSGTLLVCAEQGLGDEILQAGMISDLETTGLNLVWEVEPRLVGIFQRSFPKIRAIPRQDTPPDLGSVDAQIPAWSLGKFLRNDKAAFPNRKSYIKADPGRVEELRSRLNLKLGEKLVGVSWLSQNENFGGKKSTSLNAWRDSLRTPAVKFVDLQYGDTAAERAAADTGLIHITDLDLTNDIEGVAALISLCDLVVTVSNTTAHIAGALGVPVWVLVSAGGGRLWYWGDESVTVPDWYPTARVIRQRQGESWNVALNTTAMRLRDFVNMEMKTDARCSLN